MAVNELIAVITLVCFRVFFVIFFDVVVLGHVCDRGSFYCRNES